MSKKVLLWNNDNFGNFLKKELPKQKIDVVTSYEEFIEKHTRIPSRKESKKPRTMENIKEISEMYVLAELHWNNKYYSNLYGYDLAKEIILLGFNINFIFFSFLSVKQINITENSTYLGSRFPLYQLPKSFNDLSEFRFNILTESKMALYRDYFFKKNLNIDYIEHMIKPLTKEASKEKIENIFNLNLIYNKALFPSHLNEFIIKHKSDVVNKPDKREKFRNELILKIRKLIESEDDDGSFKKKDECIMIIEDEDNVRTNLKNNLKEKFNVESYKWGLEALNNLEKNKIHYSAIIVDGELKKDDGISDQSCQGVDIIEKASIIPHLVIYLLTKFPKKAVSAIENAHQNNRAIYIPKDPDKGLDTSHLSYDMFASQLYDKINERKKYLKGPGSIRGRSAFDKGLKSIYWHEQEESDWKTEIIKLKTKVTQWIKSPLPVSLPPLFGQDKPNYSKQDLFNALIHRFVILYQISSQLDLYNEAIIDFEEFDKKFKYNKTSNKKYLTTFLSFSIKNPTEHKQQDRKWIIQINKQKLFEEEESWLGGQLKKPIIFYDLMYNISSEIKKYLSFLYDNKYELMLENITGFLEKNKTNLTEYASSLIIIRDRLTIYEKISDNELNLLKSEYGDLYSAFEGVKNSLKEIYPDH